MSLSTVTDTLAREMARLNALRDALQELESLGGLENVVKELTDQKAALEAEVTDLRDQSESAKKDIKSQKAAQKKAMDDYDATIAAKGEAATAAANKLMDVAHDECAALRASAAADIAAAKAEADAELAAVKQAVDDGDADAKSLAIQVIEARNELADTKLKIAQMKELAKAFAQ